MCLILFAYQVHPRYRLVLAANRDEFYARQTAPLDVWHDHPEILGGRDLEQQGTWMGVTRTGRLSAITNYRDPLSIRPGAPSRGHLVADFLMSRLPPEDYLQHVSAKSDAYNGFNLIVGDKTTLFYYSNRNQEVLPLGPGIYGLSNHQLDTPWPKVAQGKKRLNAIVENQKSTDISVESIFDLLQDQTIAPDDLLPPTGVGLDWERMLSPIFITSPDYGTRSSSVLLFDYGGQIRFIERTWQSAQEKPHALFTREVEL